MGPLSSGDIVFHHASFISSCFAIELLVFVSASVRLRSNEALLSYWRHVVSVLSLAVAVTEPPALGPLIDRSGEQQGNLDRES